MLTLYAPHFFSRPFNHFAIFFFSRSLCVCVSFIINSHNSCHLLPKWKMKTVKNNNNNNNDDAAAEQKIQISKII